MIELIEALFAGAYLGGQSIKRKTIIAECSRLRDAHDASLAKFTDTSREIDMLNRFFKDHNAITENEVSHDALMDIFGENWKDLYNQEYGCNVHGGLQSSNGIQGFRGVRDIVFHVWLSQYGIISSKHNDGYNIGIRINNIEFNESPNVGKRACFVIQSNITALHPGENVYLVRQIPEPPVWSFNNNVLIWNFHAAWFPKTKTEPVRW